MKTHHGRLHKNIYTLDMSFGEAIRYIEEINYVETDGTAIRDDILRLAAKRKIRVWGLRDKPQNDGAFMPVSFDKLELIGTPFLTYCTGMQQFVPVSPNGPARSTYKLYMQVVASGPQYIVYLHVSVNRSQIEAYFKKRG